MVAAPQRARTRRASCARGSRRTRPAAARARACARGRCRSPRTGRRAARPATPARGSARGRGAGTGAAARPGTRRARTRRAGGASSARPARRRAEQPLRQTSPSACSSRSASVTRGASTTGPPVGRARVRVRPREQPAQVRPAGRVADEQRDVPRRRRLGSPRRSAVGERPAGRCHGCVDHVDLRPVDRLQPHRLGGLRELHRPVDAVVVGERERLVAELRRRPRQLGRQRRRRRGTRRRSGRGARRTSYEHMFA